MHILLTSIHRRCLPVIFLVLWLSGMMLGFWSYPFFTHFYVNAGYTLSIHYGHWFSRLVSFGLPVVISILGCCLRLPAVLLVYSFIKAASLGLCLGFVSHLYGASSWIIYLRFFLIPGFSSFIFLWLGFRFLKGFTFHVGFYSRI